MPLSMNHGSRIVIFTIPTMQSLGKNERDYSNVKVNAYQDDQLQPAEENEVAYVSSGKLGQLLGGLRHIADQRDIMTREEICQVQADQYKHLVDQKNAEVIAARELLQKKRQRSAEWLEHYEDRVKVLKEKESNMRTLETTWQTVWQHVVRGEDHVRKEEADTWKAYFLKMTGRDHTIDSSCPDNLESIDMPFSDMMMHLASFCSKLGSNLKHIQLALCKAEQNYTRIGKAQERQQKTAERKISKVTDPKYQENAKNLGFNKGFNNGSIMLANMAITGSPKRL